MIRTLLVLGSVLALAWSATNWRRATRFVLLLLVVEGALRKWVFPGAQDLIYFAKDVFLIGAVVGAWRSGELTPSIRRIPKGILPVLGLGFLFGLLELFNPSLPSILVGLVGLKSYFLYATLLALIPAAFPSDRELMRTVRLLLVLALPSAALAGLQFSSPTNSALNTYARAGEGADIAVFGTESRARVTGTFSYISGFGSYLQAVSLLSLGLLGARGFRLKGSLLYLAVLAAALLATLMTGSRGPILLLLLILPIYLWLTVAAERGDAGAIGRIAAIIALLAALLSSFGGEALEAFRERAAGTEGEITTRSLYPFTAPFHALDEAGLTGFGIGAMHPAVTAITGGVLPDYLRRGIATEAETGKVMLEVGPIGFLLVYIPRLILVIAAARIALRLRTRAHRALGAAALAWLLTQIVGNVIFDPTSGLLYWFFAGFLLALQRIEELAAATAEEPRRAGPVSVPAPRRRPEPAVPAW